MWGENVIVLLVRLLGLFLLLAGMALGLMALQEAWLLYREPERIARFHQAVETGAHLDKALGELLARQLSAAGTSTGLATETEENEDVETVQPKAPGTEMSVSYFAAWILVMLVLLMVGRIAFGAVAAGAELALRDSGSGGRGGKK